MQPWRLVLILAWSATSSGAAHAQGTCVSDGMFFTGDNELGTAVSVSEGREAVGVPLQFGPLRPFVLLYTVDVGVWELETFLDSPLPTSDTMSDFGETLDLDGDTIVIGAPMEFFVFPIRTGAAYVFTLTGSTWQMQQHFLPPVVQSGARYGHAVALHGDSLLIGAPQTDPAAQGLAEVHVRNGATWTLEQTLVPAGLDPDARAGSAVDIQGDRAAVAAPGQVVGGLANAGRVFVYERTGTIWNQVAALDSPVPTQDGRFGESLALDGARLVVGAPGEPLTGADQGLAHVFAFDGQGWTLEQTLTGAGSATQGCRFGADVALEGARVAVGAPGQVIAGNLHPGTVKVFALAGGTWIEHVDLLSSSPLPFKGSGESVDLDGGQLITGAPASRRATSWLVDPPIVSTFCTAKVASAGCSSAIGWVGTPSATSTEAFRVNTTDVLNNQFGILIYGPSYGGPSPFHGSHLCVYPVTRTPLQVSGGSSSGVDCSGAFYFDFNDLIQSGTDPSLTVGSWRYAQFWYRDPYYATGMALTNGIRFLIQP
jgi:hypothetical protein